MLRLLSLAALVAVAAAAAVPEGRKYKICVPEHVLEDCNQLAAQQGVRLSCVPARDRLECLDKIHSHQADFEMVDPEDMYVASHFSDDNFVVFKEIRTNEEPNEEFRYEAVAVIHKDLDISSVQGLRGLRSCHTGVARNVGYKIPLTRLNQFGVIGALNLQNLTSRENELKALSDLFSKACIVGKWSAEPAHNQRLKDQYRNLCALCERPDVCDYPDKYSGYDGALRCLAENGGQVAWTKVYFVKKFFGIPIGTTDDNLAVATPTSANPEDYAYLCPDGTKKPILGRACRWAARPWQGYITYGEGNAAQNADIPQMQQEISHAAQLGEEQDAVWLKTVLGVLKNKTKPVNPTSLLHPGQYLDKSNYTDVISRNYAGGLVRICVTCDTGLAKCRALARSAFSRDIRPSFDCIREATVDACLATIRDNGADVIAVDADVAKKAQDEMNLQPLLQEKYGNDTFYYAVAVVKKGSGITTVEGLRGKKSCLAGYNTPQGWVAPVSVLLQKGLLSPSSCPYSSALASFFAPGGSCVPGSDVPELCEACAGDVDAAERKETDKCSATPKEAYYGCTGAFRCLASGQGDVAFISHKAVAANTDGHNKASWASTLQSSDYELLCPDGGVQPVDQFESCHWAKVPSQVMVTSHTKPKIELESLRQALLAAATLYNEHPEYFKLFGEYSGRSDLIFKDKSTGLEVLDSFNDVHNRYLEAVQKTRGCSTQAKA